MTRNPFLRTASPGEWQTHRDTQTAATQAARSARRVVSGPASSGFGLGDHTPVPVGEAAHDRQTAVAIVLDAIQYLAQDDAGALMMAIHLVSQRQLPVANRSGSPADRDRTRIGCAGTRDFAHQEKPELLNEMIVAWLCGSDRG